VRSASEIDIERDIVSVQLKPEFSQYNIAPVCTAWVKEVTDQKRRCGTTITDPDRHILAINALAPNFSFLPFRPAVVKL
jgi:hypothetical protein